MDNDNSAFVAIMAKMKSENTDQSKNDFIKAAVRAAYFVPVIITPKPENGVIKEGSNIGYHNMKSNDGKRLLMAFTSVDELKKWKGYKEDETQILKHTYGDINKFVTEMHAYDGFIIDPYGENVALKADLMENIAQVLLPMSVKSERINIEQGLKPATNYSQEMVDAVTNYLKINKDVKKAYLLETVREGDTKPTVIIAVDITGDKVKACFNAIGANARKYLPKDESIGVVSANDKVVMGFLEGVEPFYEKN